MENPSKNKIIFIGTGCSTGLPQLNHLLDYNSQLNSTNSFKATEHQSSSGSRKGEYAVRPQSLVCETCMKALQDEDSPNRRNNVSILLQIKNYNILIDCGKTFREGALKQFRKHKINKIDAIILTHGHEDAVGGIDEIRTIQEWEYFEKKIDKNIEDNSIDTQVICQCKRPMPVYLSLETFYTITQRFPYIFEASMDPLNLHRKVSVLEFILLSDSLKNDINPLDSPSDLPQIVHNNATKFTKKNSNGFSEITFTELESSNIKIEAIPVYHGGNYKCLAFIIVVENHNIVYISDVSSIPDEIAQLLTSIKIKVLIMDCLFYDRPNFGHFSLFTGLEWVEKLEPENVYFIGMHCSIEHNLGCAFLKEWLLTSKVFNKTKLIELAYDGLEIPL